MKQVPKGGIFIFVDIDPQSHKLSCCGSIGLVFFFSYIQIGHAVTKVRKSDAIYLKRYSNLAMSKRGLFRGVATGGPEGPEPPRNSADQLTLFKPGGQIMPPPRFKKLSTPLNYLCS